MALTGWSTTNYLDHPAAVWPGAEPFLMSAWIYSPGGSSTKNIMALGQTTANEMRRLYLSITHNLVVQSRTASGVQSTTSNTVTTNTWTHAAGAFLASTATANSRQAYLANVVGPADGSASAVATPSTMTIGKYPTAATDIFPNTGGLAEISIWDLAGLTQTDRDNLVAELATLQGGTSARNPLAIHVQAQPWAGKLVAYWSLRTTADILDEYASFDLTMQGTLTAFASHPPVDLPPTGGFTPQYARPSADTFISGWEEQDGTTDALYARINEDPADNAQYIRTGLSPSNAIYVAKLSSLPEPALSDNTNHTLKLRLGKDPVDGQAITVTVQLRTGYVNEGSPGALVTEEVYTNVAGGFTEVAIPLLTTEADDLDTAEYLSSLFIRIVAHAP